MCGLIGFIHQSKFMSQNLEAIAVEMAKELVHRGPDDQGIWVDADVGVALGHRRLSILDLSVAGHQPMQSASKRYVLVFNGEIYNHKNLRHRLESEANNNIRWIGHSDTETLLACIDAWGLEDALKDTIGMFAIALWDRQERRLSLARDRLGEKPLYYGWQKDAFIFGSELKALKVHPSFVGEIDNNVIALQLRYNYIPAPYSIYKGIYKLTPGTVVELKISDCKIGELPRPKPYWSLRDIVVAGKKNTFEGNDEDAAVALELLLKDAVGQQVIADVPLGAFLSGGIDSSTIVALMQSQSRRPVKTFTIGFNDAGYDEAKYAKAVAQHLGTDHTELYVSPNDALSVIPRLPELYDEPFSDASQIPTFLVSQLTRQHVAVSISGDGGDELFGGYNRYHASKKLLNSFVFVPTPIRRSIAHTLNGIPIAVWKLMGRHCHINQFPEKMRKIGDIIGAKNADDVYYQLISHWKEPTEVVINSSESPVLLTDQASWPNLNDFEERMMYLDTMSYLPDDILVKVDRAAMGVSLETRVPFLDHRVVEFAWHLPLSMKIRNGQGKWLLRQVLHKYVPKHLIERPKAGFAVPIDAWLRGPLREWAETLLNETRMKNEGFFEIKSVKQKWREHISGQRDWQYHLWGVLMFQAWLEAQRT